MKEEQPTLHFSALTRQVTHAIVDGARAGDQLISLRHMAVEVQSLYREGPEQDLAAIAPHLLRCSASPALLPWLFAAGWGKSWGVLMLSDVSFGDLHRHFRHFLIVKDESGRKLYFRFYDPRVLRVFLPTCTKTQLREFFGPVEVFVLEDENPTNALVFSLEDGVLIRDSIDLTKESQDLRLRKAPTDAGSEGEQVIV